MIINTNYSLIKGAIRALQSNPQVAQSSKAPKPVAMRSNTHGVSVSDQHEQTRSLLSETAASVIRHHNGTEKFTQADIPTLQRKFTQIRSIEDNGLPERFRTFKLNLLRDIPKIICQLNALNS